MSVQRRLGAGGILSELRQSKMYGEPLSDYPSVGTNSIDPTEVLEYLLIRLCLRVVVGHVAVVEASFGSEFVGEFLVFLDIEHSDSPSQSDQFFGNLRPHAGLLSD